MPSMDELNNDRILKEFSSDGFVVVPDLLSFESRRFALMALYNLYRKYDSSNNPIPESEIRWDNLDLHRQLIEFRNRDPENFGDVRYDARFLRASANVFSSSSLKSL